MNVTVFRLHACDIFDHHSLLNQSLKIYVCFINKILFIVKILGTLGCCRGVRNAMSFWRPEIMLTQITQIHAKRL